METGDLRRGEINHWWTNVMRQTLSALEKEDAAGREFMSGRKNIKPYSWADDKKYRGENRSSLVTILRKFRENNAGLSSIPRGVENGTDLRLLVVKDTLKSSVVDRLVNNIVNKEDLDNEYNGINLTRDPQKKDIVNLIELDYQGANNKTTFPDWDSETIANQGLIKHQLEVYLAACKNNSEVWEKNGSNVKEWKDMKPELRVIDKDGFEVNNFPNIPLMTRLGLIM